MFIELSHVIRAGMVTYPGLPEPAITPHLTRDDSRSHYAPGTEFAIDVITMCGNTGTYLDSPFHRYPDGGDLTTVSLEQTVDLPAVVVRVGEGLAIGPELLDSIDAEGIHSEGIDIEGKAVLLHTGDAARFGTPDYSVGAHYLTEMGARVLVDRGAVLVGIDAINIDHVTPQGTRPAHSVLLAAGVPIVEHLTNLDQIPDTGALFTAVPLRIAGFGTVSVRAFAKITERADTPSPPAAGDGVSRKS